MIYPANPMDKQARNLRITLAIIIAKLKLNTAQAGEGKPYFVNREGLLRYIQALVSHAMTGGDKLEIPEFYYNREDLDEYSQLKHLLASALTKLQGDPHDANLTEVYKGLLNGLRHI